MTSTTFVDLVGPPVNAAWLNDVNGATYNGTAVYTPAGTGAVATTVQSKLRESVSVKDFGAVGDGVTDDTAAIAAALLAGSGKKVYVPAGTYKITSTLTVPTSTYFYGTGLGSSIIQYTSNIPIITAQGSGTKTRISGFYLAFSSAQPIGNTNALGINVQNFDESSMDNLMINNCYSGIYCGASSGISPNYIYSSTLRDIRIEGYSGYGLYLSTVAANNSGNVLQNIYIVNTSTTTPVTCGAYINAWDDGVINQINIEQCQPSAAPMIISGCNNLTINAIHFEAITYAVDFGAMISIQASRVNITGLSVLSCTYTATNIASICSLGGTGYVTGGQVVLQNVMDRGNTITSTNKSVFYSSSASSTARLIGATLNGFTAGLSGGLGTFLQNDNAFVFSSGGASFNDYREGTWTPVQGAGLTVVGAFSSSGTYTKVGRQVCINGVVSGATSVAIAAAGEICTGLPFTVGTASIGSAVNGTLTASISTFANGTNVRAGAAITATPVIYFTFTYFV